MPPLLPSIVRRLVLDRYTMPRAKFIEIISTLPGAPASFPMRLEDESVQQYIHFSDSIREQGLAELRKHFDSEERDYLAVHLRCKLICHCRISPKELS